MRIMQWINWVYDTVIMAVAWMLINSMSDRGKDLYIESWITIVDRIREHEAEVAAATAAAADLA